MTLKPKEKMVMGSIQGLFYDDEPFNIYKETKTEVEDMWDGSLRRHISEDCSKNENVISNIIKITIEIKKKKMLTKEVAKNRSLLFQNNLLPYQPKFFY